jgi:hypothetical protein
MLEYVYLDGENWNINIKFKFLFKTGIYFDWDEYSK